MAGTGNRVLVSSHGWAMLNRGVELLPGSGRMPVTRVGRTVRRPVMPWTPSVHALLRHLEAVGFDGAPRVIGIEDDREVLAFVDGVDAHHARDGALHSDSALAAVGRMLRRYHDAVASFQPPAGAVWQWNPDPPPQAIICHHDLGPQNTVYVDGAPVAFIDWDYAGPGLPVWDLAYAAWSFIPLYDDEYAQRHGYSTAPRGRRLRLLCDAYGLPDRSGLLDVVQQRQQAFVDMVQQRAAAGEAGFAEVWRNTNGDRWRTSMAYVARHRDDWQRDLDRPAAEEPAQP